MILAGRAIEKADVVHDCGREHDRHISPFSFADYDGINQVAIGVFPVMTEEVARLEPLLCERINGLELAVSCKVVPDFCLCPNTCHLANSCSSMVRVESNIGK